MILIIILLMRFSCLCSLTGSNYLINEEAIYFPNHHGKESASHFSNKWIVKIDDHAAAEKIAKANNFHYKGRIDDFDNYHIFEYPDHPEEHHEESFHFTYHLNKHEKVIWSQQLFGRQLYRRDFIEPDYKEQFSNYNSGRNVEEGIRVLYERNFESTQKFLWDGTSIENLTDDDENIRKLYERAFNDELWSLQWYELGYITNSTTPLLDMNLLPVYKLFNITGEGVNVLIIDDGVEHTHDDIQQNFRSDISFNLNHNITDVTPRYADPRNRHGTRCAGVVAMKANNTKCGVGIAYNAKVGGITLLDGITNDLLEAQAIKHKVEEVHIYSGSWGPQDNGQAVDGPGHLASLALLHGITKGRNGLGSLYVFAAGNGGSFGDHCGADGYVNSVYSIAIASATHEGGIPYYSERCPAIIATTYSGTAQDKIKIITTDIRNSCTLDHSGTSASAPLAAGVLALVLEANPFLTWRDVHHIMAWTAEVAPLRAHADWSQNAFGLWFTPQFGFGLINAFKMVSHARDWKTVPEKFICSLLFDLKNSTTIFTSDSPFNGAVYTDGCNNSVRYLEHVQLNVTAEYVIRGHLQIELTSPLGTSSKLMEVRKNDLNSGGFIGWPFLSLQFWGESPVGTWTVRLSDEVKAGKYRGRVRRLELILHGTTDIPPHYIEKKREYEPFDI